MKQLERIVITGGPGTGKTALVRQLEIKGYPCYHEVIRDFTEEAIQDGDPDSFVTNPLVFVADPLAFNQKLLDGRLRHFKAAAASERDQVFFDRGLPDVLAYMDYFDQEYGPHFEETCSQHRYDKVFLLPPWKAIYTSDAQRLESFQEAVEIHEALLATYTRFGYEPISVPTGTLEARSAFVEELIRSRT